MFLTTSTQSAIFLLFLASLSLRVSLCDLHFLSILLLSTLQSLVLQKRELLEREKKKSRKACKEKIIQIVARPNKLIRILFSCFSAIKAKPLHIFFWAIDSIENEFMHSEMRK